MNIIPTSKELIELFDLPNKDFKDPHELIGNTGFSVKRPISPEIAKILGSEEIEKHITLIHLSLNTNDKVESKIPIYIRTGLTYFNNNQYLLTFHDIKNIEYTPIQIVSSSEYYIDIITKKIYDNKDIEIKPINLLYREYTRHIKPTTEIGRKFKVQSKSFFAKSIYYISEALKYLFYWTSWNLEWLKKNPYIEETHKIIHKPDVIEFNGIKGDKNSLFLFCLLHLICYYINYNLLNFELDILKTIFKNNFLTLVYTISSYIIFNFILEKIIYNIIFNKILNLLFRIHEKIQLRILF